MRKKTDTIIVNPAHLVFGERPTLNEGEAIVEEIPVEAVSNDYLELLAMDAHMARCYGKRLTK